jgi:hypothetical protein
MCLMCEEEDPYFLYLERLEAARKAARGETTQPNPGWLWPSFTQAASAGAPQPAAKPRSDFICDAPE